MMRIILALAFIASSGPAIAADASMPIMVTLIDCRTIEAAERQCRTTRRCCNVWRDKLLMAGQPVPRDAEPGDKPDPENKKLASAAPVS